MQFCSAGKATGCALPSSASGSWAVEWETQLSVCSGKVFWLEELKAVFSSKWGYKLVSLPGSSGRRSSKATKAVCGLESSRPVPEVPWQNRSTGFALRMISSVSLSAQT